MVSDEEDLRIVLEKSKKACRRIGFLIKVIFAVLVAWWVLSLAFAVWEQSISGSSVNVARSDASVLVLYAACFLVMILVCLGVVGMFSEASKGETPFTMDQVRRLRSVAALLVVYELLEILLSVCSSRIGGEVDIATVDVFPCAAAAVLFAFSFVFKYGILLQEFSDETL